MSIKKRSINSQNGYNDYEYLKTNYNTSGINNYSHKEDTNNNFNLTSITLEDLDQAVYLEFNKRFRIGEKEMPVLLLDAEVSSLMNQNYEQFDRDKGFLNLPFLTMLRTQSVRIRKTNPTNKMVVYAIPIKKANGIVYEEYITEPPIPWELTYELKFISNYRQSTNEMEEQMAYYFRNKRNMILWNGERFVISPVSQDTSGEMEIINRETIDQRTLYMTTYNLKLWAWTRDISNMQKRERPNKFTLDINVNDSVNTESSSTSINVERYELDTNKLPLHPTDKFVNYNSAKFSSTNIKQD